MTNITTLEQSALGQERKTIRVDWDWCVKNIPLDEELDFAHKEMYPLIIPKIRDVLTGEFMTTKEIFDKAGLSGFLANHGKKDSQIREYMRCCLDWVCNNTHTIQGTYIDGHKAGYRILCEGDSWSPRPIAHKKKKKSKRAMRFDSTKAEPTVDISTLTEFCAVVGTTYNELVEVLFAHRQEIESWVLPKAVREMMAVDGLTKEQASRIYAKYIE